MSRTAVTVVTMLGAVLVVATACAQQPAETSERAGTDEVVARMGDDVITATELEELAEGALVNLRRQMYDAKRAALEAEIFERLVARAAEEAGLTAEEYLAQEVEARLGEVDETQVESVLQQYRSQLPPDDAAARQQVVNYLQQQQRQQLRAGLKSRLFEEADVRILLEPPRVEAEVFPFNPTRGAEDAAVTLMEFTDFQCPYCARVQSTLEQLLERYEGHLRHVFKHLPLAMHGQAELAAEASLCAADQGGFWELHHWMFDNARSLSRESILTAAAERDLDREALAACLDEGVHSEHVARDQAQARGVGITATPGFLVNGRVLSGAQPMAKFVELIDEELRLAGIEPPAETAVEETEGAAQQEE